MIFFDVKKYFVIKHKKFDTITYYVYSMSHQDKKEDKKMSFNCANIIENSCKKIFVSEIVEQLKDYEFCDAFIGSTVGYIDNEFKNGRKLLISRDQNGINFEAIYTDVDLQGIVGHMTCDSEFNIDAYVKNNFLQIIN